MAFSICNDPVIVSVFSDLTCSSSPCREAICPSAIALEQYWRLAFAGHMDFQHSFLVFYAHFVHVYWHWDANVALEFLDFASVVANPQLVQMQFSSHFR
jgi:hypothetical protein